MSKRPAKPEEYPWIVPSLTVKDPDAALAFYQKAFGFEKKMSMPGPDGKTMHAEVSWRGQVVMFGAEGTTESLQSARYSGSSTAGGTLCLCRRRGRLVQACDGGRRQSR